MRFLILVASLWITLGSISMPSQALDLQGVAVFRNLDTDVYLAAVYSNSSDSNLWLTSEQPIRLEMRVLDKLSPRTFYRLWNEGLAINLSEREMNDRIESITRFTYLLKDDLREGDRVVISNESGRTQVSVDDVALLTIDDPFFPGVLLQAWIGRFPRSPLFRDTLLAADPQVQQQLAGQFAMLTIRPGRRELIQSWNLEEGRDPVVAGGPTATTIATDVAVVSAVAGSGVDSGSVAGTGPSNMATQSMPVDIAQTQTQASVPSASGVVLPSAGAVVETSGLDETGGAVVNAAREPVVDNDVNRAVEAALVAQTAGVVFAEAQKQEEKKQHQAAQWQQRVVRQQAESHYYRQLISQANSRVQYPRQALQRKLEGAVRVSVVIARDGSLLGTDISESSGSGLLDSAAQKAARLAAPFPAIPEHLPGDQFDFDIPFRFVMDHHPG